MIYSVLDSAHATQTQNGKPRVLILVFILEQNKEGFVAVKAEHKLRRQGYLYNAL